MLLPYLEKNIAEGGYLLEENGITWPLEYASADVTLDSAMFVLNGSLVGTLATQILADELDNDQLRTIVEKSIDSYKKMSSEFIYPDGYWSYYMLNKKNSNAPHYMIFELQLFDALYKANGDPFFSQQAELRRDMFKNILKVEGIEQENGDLEILLLRACAPDPYLIDINETMVEFYDADHHLIHTEFKRGRNIREDQWLTCRLSSDAVKAVVYSISRDSSGEIEWKTLMCEKDIERRGYQGHEQNKVPFECTASLDGRKTEKHEIVIDPDLSDKGYARLYFDLKTPIAKDSKDYWAYEINNPSDNSLSIKLIVYDSENNSSSRYYIPLKKGKNLILWNIAGFVDCHNIQDIKTLGIFLYTDGIEEPFTIEYGDLYRFDSPAALKSYEDHSAYRIMTDEDEKEDRYIADWWETLITPYLKQTLWDDLNRYDASNYLMVPLYYAFQTGDNQYIGPFDRHIRNYVDQGMSTTSLEDEETRLSNLQYYYFLSEYLALNVDSGEGRQGPYLSELSEHILNDLERVWTDLPAAQYGGPDFKGLSERLAWKLNHAETRRSYYQAVNDEERFVFAIAANLRYVHEKAGEIPLLNDILDCAYNTYQKKGVWKEGRWLFQPGVWYDHPDYEYAGYTADLVDGSARPVLNIGEDVSHSHRVPLWISSLRRASRTSEEAGFYTEILDGLGKQFFERVLVKPDDVYSYYRTNNFMDGTNGYYRYKYETVALNNGYAPYELSGTLLLGWWTFLSDQRINDVYYTLYHSFPLSSDALQVYIGPNTTRKRNEFVADPQSYQNGYRELIALLASRL